VLEETNQTEEIVARVAALDIGKAKLVCCIRVPGQGRRGKRTGGGGDLPDHDPLAAGVGRPAGRVGRDQGGDGGYQRLRKAPFYLLEAQGFEVWLVNAKDVKHLPGRPKTDKLDAVWLAKLAERGMLRRLPRAWSPWTSTSCATLALLAQAFLGSRP
jgi:transposase